MATLQAWKPHPHPGLRCRRQDHRGLADRPQADRRLRPQQSSQLGAQGCHQHLRHPPHRNCHSTVVHCHLQYHSILPVLVFQLLVAHAPAAEEVVVRADGEVRL